MYKTSCLSAIGDYFGPNPNVAVWLIFMSCTSAWGLATVDLYALCSNDYGWQNAFL